ncbi:MAG: hypothetical protein NTY53_26180 [Kiritimatiellaeota bacterium]|nr:hypothetical protein [Kiritimatiellota bacterium]
MKLSAGMRPLLNGCVQLHLDRAVVSNWTARLRVVLSRPSDETDRQFWNTRLAYPQYSWMSRVRVWDVDAKWLWPNLS